MNGFNTKNKWACKANQERDASHQEDETILPDQKNGLQKNVFKK